MRTSVNLIDQRQAADARCRKVGRTIVFSIVGLLFAVSLTVIVTAETNEQATSAEMPQRQVEVGRSHACILEADGRVTCWGDDTLGQVSDWGRKRYEAERFASISAGSAFTCGILTDGPVMCWGYPEAEHGTHDESDHQEWSEWTANPDVDYAGWVNTPPRTVRFKPHSLTVGNYHACAIQTSGELSCWGKAGDARLMIPTDEDDETITDWTAVEAGWAHACAVREGGTVVCFGRQTYGRSDGPVGAGSFIDVTLGVYNGCALAEDGSVECWGAPPVPDKFNRTIKTPPKGVLFTSIEMSTTEFHSCGIDQDGAVHCWGIVTSSTHEPRMAPPPGSFASISVGSSNSCGLDADGVLNCWGDDNSRLFMPPDGAYTQTSGGSDFSCALKADQSITCWGGDNAHGQLDAPDGKFSLISSGHTHSCAIRANSNGVVACWGGENPPGTEYAGITNSYAIVPRARFIHIDAGPDLTCGVNYHGKLQCWGASTHGRWRVPSGAFRSVAVGATHVCAIRNARWTLVCWGEDLFFDADGDGTPDDIDGKGNHTTTKPPKSPHRYIDITASEGHTCAIREDGKAVCWGYHIDGRNNLTGSSDDPQGFGAHEYVDVATGGPGNCAIRSNDGSLACWNAEKPQFWPSSEILAMTGFKSLSAGTSHMCGIDSSGGLVCWGVTGVIPYPDQLRRFSPSPTPAVTQTPTVTPTPTP